LAAAKSMGTFIAWAPESLALGHSPISVESSQSLAVRSAPSSMVISRSPRLRVHKYAQHVVGERVSCIVPSLKIDTPLSPRRQYQWCAVGYSQPRCLKNQYGSMAEQSIISRAVGYPASHLSSGMYSKFMP
jgi:hypothetical protein